LLTIEDDKYNSTLLKYAIDSNSSLAINENIKNSLPGWEMKDIILINEDKIYNTNWGLPNDNNKSSYSTLSMGISIARPTKVYPLKILLPMIIVVFISFAGFWNNIDMTYDTRMATASGSLLASIFLQLTFGDKLPRGIDLTLMDWMFNLSYIFILYVIIITITLKNLEKQLQQIEKIEKEKQQQNRDNNQNHKVDEELQELEEITSITEPNEISEHPDQQQNHPPQEKKKTKRVY